MPRIRRGHRADRDRSRVVAQASVGGLLLVLCFLFGFSLISTRHAASISAHADTEVQLSTLYADARFAVGQEESLERKYRLEPGAVVRAAHTAAERQLDGDLSSILRLDRSPATPRFISGLLRQHLLYKAASASMLRAVDRGQPREVIRLDHAVVDPIFGVLQAAVYARSAQTAKEALDESAQLRQAQSTEIQGLVIAFAAGLLLLSAFGWILITVRRHVDAAQIVELERVSVAAVTDSLTGLSNHRAFQEDLATALATARRKRPPLTLVMLDLDGLKLVNDKIGHQAGDQRLQALAGALRSKIRAGDGAYRVGGDEFAVILTGIDAWGGLEFAQRLQVDLDAHKSGGPLTVGAGVAQALPGDDRDGLIQRADCALITAKRRGHRVVLYTAELEPPGASGLDDDGPARDELALASALALAVDAKDAYTRSHSQTVSELVALLGDELGLSGGRIARLRLAGLLHDVGKIGVPDAVLNKPGQLTAEEYEQIKRHAVLGEEIVAAAGLTEAAGWIRHHHERMDGGGYPDGLRGTEIPLESRIIFVADAFEAMTADRPYRSAPGRDVAIAELREHATSQFDPDVVTAMCRALGVPPAPRNPHLATVT